MLRGWDAQAPTIGDKLINGAGFARHEGSTREHQEAKMEARVGGAGDRCRTAVTPDPARGSDLRGHRHPGEQI